jgi:hypothetical protein
MVFVLFHQRAATRLSWRRACEPRSGRFSALARLSLLAIASSMLPACLVDDPPPLIEPRQTPPRLDYSQALPGLDQVMIRNEGDLIEFRMPVTSEDAGQSLTGKLFLDYRGDGTLGDTLNQNSLPPSTLDDPNPRVLSIDWQVRDGVAPGCHRMTLRVSHLNNFSLDPKHSAEVLDKNDLAEAFWFANINVSPESANQLVDCPQASSRDSSP